MPGLTLEGLRQYGASAARFAERLEGAGLEDFSVDTDGLRVPDVVKAVFAGVADWPPVASRA